MFKMWSCSSSSYLIACFLLLAIVTGPAKGNVYDITSVTVTNNTGPSLMANDTNTFTFTCDVDFTCTGDCDMDLMISWNLNGMNISDNSLFSVGNTVDNTSTLTLTGPVNVSHAGVYRCTATVNGVSANSGDQTLTVIVPDPMVSIMNATANIGDIAELTCTATFVDGVTPVYSWSPVSGNTGSLSLSANLTNAGQHNCTVTSSYGGANSAHVTLPGDVVAPAFLTVTVSATATATGTATVVAGDPHTLSCTTNATSGLTIAYEWTNSAMNNVSSANNYNINPVTTGDAGTYTCTVTISHTNEYVSILTPMPNDTATLSVRIPPPTVTLSSVSVAVGTTATLTCTVTISPFVDLNGLNYMTRTVTPSTGDTLGVVQNTNTRTQSFSFTINNVMSTNGVSYTCTVRLSHNNNANIIASDTRTGTGTIYVSSVAVTPKMITRLDVSPYNEFSLNCTVTTDPSPNNPQITYSWTNDTEVVVSNEQNGAIENILNVAASVMGNFTFTCAPNVTVDGADGTAMPSDSTSVTIKGPSTPVQPQIVPATTTPDTATIRWSVSETSYTPENYTITYSSDNFTSDINSIIANMTALDPPLAFITATNIQYTYTIQGLSIGIQYNYFINSTNTVGSTNSTTEVFTTSDAVPYAPSNVVLTAVNSSVLRLSWGDPTPYTGDITDFNYTCNGVNNTASFSSSDTQFGNFINGDRVVILSGLEPFREYSCSVTAATSAGVGPPATANGVTGQAAPSGPPLNFTIRPTNSSYLYLTLSWSLPSLTAANGIITSYTYECYEGVTTVVSGVVDRTSVDVTFPSITPFTNYSCNVNASTVAGTGPPVSQYGMTAEAAPTEVTSLILDRSSDTSFNVMWSLPATPNGVIRNYTVSIRYYSNMTPVKSDATTNETQLSIDQLRPEVPYVVSVSATTNGGTGPAASQTNFTKEGEPGPVRNVTFQRISPTSVNVSWIPLTLEEAKGFVTGYTVTLTPSTNNNRKRQSSVIMTAQPDQSYIVFSGLSAEASYSISVSGSTAAGTGETSSGPTIPTAVTPSDGGNTAVIVAVVIALLLLIIMVVVVVIVILYCLRNRRMKGELTIEENTVALQEMKKGSAGDLNNGKEDEPELVALNTDIDKERWEPIPVAEFAAHTAKLHSDRDLGFEDEYKSFRNIPQGSYTTAKLPENVSKNRFENVYSYDSSRVELTAIPDKRGTDYINASFIDGYKRPKAYIAAQGPLSNTVGDFWRMVWEFQLPTIVMLTELIERGIDKCTCYWPRALNETMDVGYDLQVTLVEQQQYVDYKLKKFLILNTSSTGGRLDVTHYHFLAWPDHGVPADKTIMLAFIRRVRQTHSPEGPPLIVHCSAGVGRTGTFITLDSMQQRLDKKEKDLNIYEFLANMRTMRVLMVQTEAQYVYIHDALSEYITCGDTSMTTKRLKIAMDELTKVSEQKSGYQKQLELINQVCRQPSEGLLCDALSKTNVGKNRFPDKLDTLPYDMTRVRLRTASGTGDYINANYVDGYKHRGAFLATQAPSTDTVEDLWRMIWEQWSSSIVMLCNLEENDKEVCAQYWPDKVDESVTYGKMVVKLVSEEKRPHYIIRKLMLSQESTYINVSAGAADHLMVTQFHYGNWAEDEKPKDETPLLKLIDQLLHNQMNTGNKAITVICSDGVGRTGSFMCMYSVLERIKIEGVADVFQYIKGARFNRPGLVQNMVQYEFCHDIILEYINSFDAYHNF